MEWARQRRQPRPPIQERCSPPRLALAPQQGKGPVPVAAPQRAMGWSLPPAGRAGGGLPAPARPAWCSPAPPVCWCQPLPPTPLQRPAACRRSRPAAASGPRAATGRKDPSDPQRRAANASARSLTWGLISSYEKRRMYSQARCCSSRDTEVDSRPTISMMRDSSE